MANSMNQHLKTFFETRRRSARGRRKRLRDQNLILLLRRRQKLLLSGLFSFLFAANLEFGPKYISRSCRRLPRNGGWWQHVWTTYDNNRFKANFRVSRATFVYILTQIRSKIDKFPLTEDPLPVELRLAVCLYRLGRGDHIHTISELFALGKSTVCNIVLEVSAAIVEMLWEDAVTKNFPTTEKEYKTCMIHFEQEWKFPCCFGAVDGSHLPIKCPNGGQEAQKEYHNFKDFYSIVLMAMIDYKYRFIWASCGFPGNSHDSIILQSTNLYTQITENNLLPNIAKCQDGVKIGPVILGDGAFPFKTWLLKPFTNAALSPQQRYFNYRLSRARMVTECAYGQLKGRWRILFKKCESKKESMKIMCLACIVLHNLCIDLGDILPRAWDLNYDDHENKRRPAEAVRELLNMTRCRKIADTSKQASIIRNCLKDKFWREKQGAGVN